MGWPSPSAANAIFLIRPGMKELATIPTPLGRQKEMAIPWKPVNTMSSSKVRQSPQPSVNTTISVKPRMRTLRRPITSAIAPEIKRVQPDVSLDEHQPVFHPLLGSFIPIDCCSIMEGQSVFQLRHCVVQSGITTTEARLEAWDLSESVLGQL